MDTNNYTIKYEEGLTLDDVKEIIPSATEKQVGYQTTGMLRLQVFKGEEKVGEVFYSTNSETWVCDTGRWDEEICYETGKGTQTGFVNFSSCVERDETYTLKTLIEEVEERLNRDL